MNTGQPSTNSAPSFTPSLDVLPPAQRRLWPELAFTPEEFTLHGGTAIALQIGHRASVDFDFFAARRFAPNDLLHDVPYLHGAVVRQAAPDTLTVTVEREGSVQISFFGGIELGQVAPAARAAGPNIKVASLIDLAGFKVAVVTQRAELRDYIDVYELLTTARISLAQMLAAAKIIYGAEFNPLIALKALAYFEDAALAGLAAEIRNSLAAAVRTTDPHRLPNLAAVRTRPGRS